MSIRNRLLIAVALFSVSGIITAGDTNSSSNTVTINQNIQHVDLSQESSGILNTIVEQQQSSGSTETHRPVPRLPSLCDSFPGLPGCWTNQDK